LKKYIESTPIKGVTSPS